MSNTSTDYSAWKLTEGALYSMQFGSLCGVRISQESSVIKVTGEGLITVSARNRTAVIQFIGRNLTD